MVNEKGEQGRSPLMCSALRLVALVVVGWSKWDLGGGMKRVGEAYSEGYAGFWGYAMGRALERLASGSALRAVVRMCILQIFFAFRSDLNTPGRIKDFDVF